jgi:hypothetical protein
MTNTPFADNLVTAHRRYTGILSYLHAATGAVKASVARIEYNN